MTLSSFTADQEKLHDSYEKKKQEITDKIESLHKTLEKLETDTRLNPGKAACNALVNAVNALQQRNPAAPEIE